MMRFENGINLRKDRKDLAKENLGNLKRVMGRYKITIPAIAIGEILNYINTEIDDDEKKTECLNWLLDFINDFGVDILPIVYNIDFLQRQHSDNCVFSIAKEIIRREVTDPNEYYGGKTLDGNDALILAQAILDECDEAVILTVDSRMNEATTPHDIIEEREIIINNKLKKLKIVDNLREI